MSVYSGEFTSDMLKKNVVTRVIFPDSPFDLEQIDKVPKTMYLLHGGGGSSGDWLRFTRIEYFARLYNFTIVLADAGNSFYCDMAYGEPYLKFFGEELPQEMNRRFRLPETAFICGQSMGGYGCVKVGMTYRDNYRAIGCLSGAVDIRDLLKQKEGPVQKLGGALYAAFGNPVEICPENDCFHLAKGLVERKGQIPLFMYCGTEDFLYEGNCRYDKYLTEIGYEHQFHTDKGSHLWSFWEEKMPLLMEELCELTK